MEIDILQYLPFVETIFTSLQTVHECMAISYAHLTINQKTTPGAVDQATKSSAVMQITMGELKSNLNPKLFTIIDWDHDKIFIVSHP